MPNPLTRADSVRVYHTGAGGDGATQASPDASLGNYRSGNEIAMLGFVRASPIAGITVEAASGACGTGSATLAATGSSELRFTPPGGTQGTAVTIANGETRTVEGGGADGIAKFLRVARTSAAALSGTETLTLADVVNNAVGFDNVTSAEAAAGDNEYRCLAFKNVSAAAIAGLTFWVGTLGTSRVSDTGQLAGSGSGTISSTGSFADWPASGFVHIRTSGGTTREIAYYSSRTDSALTVPTAGRGLLGTSAAAGAGTDSIDPVPPIRLARENPGAQPTGAVQTVANESTAPTGVTWNSGITSAAGIVVGTLPAGHWVGIWVHRAVPVGQVAIPEVLHHVRYTFDAA